MLGGLGAHTTRILLLSLAPHTGSHPCLPACLLPCTYTQVFKHNVLSGSDAVLQQLGITHGDQLVMLPARPAIKRPRAQTTPVRSQPHTAYACTHARPRHDKLNQPATRFLPSTGGRHSSHPHSHHR
jgi:hypothetical protein